MKAFLKYRLKSPLSGDLGVKASGRVGGQPQGILSRRCGMSKAESPKPRGWKR